MIPYAVEPTGVGTPTRPDSSGDLDFSGEEDGDVLPAAGCCLVTGPFSDPDGSRRLPPFVNRTSMKIEESINQNEIGVIY